MLKLNKIKSAYLLEIFRFNELNNNQFNYLKNEDLLNQLEQQKLLKVKLKDLHILILILDKALKKHY